MADDLFRVLKSVRKLVREKTEDLFGNISPLERTLREVTDEETCAVSNSLLRHIAISTHDAFTYSTVVQVVWQGISSEYWQRRYKCLCLLEFMILLGPERCRHDCASAQMTIRTLTQYRFHDGRREQGGGVRQKAENILKLISDEEYWKKMKEQAVQDSEKYAGGIENQPYISPISHMNIHTRATNPFFTGPETMPPFALRSPMGQEPNPFISNPRPAIPSQSFRRAPDPSLSRGGFYDPGDDFNTSDPFAERPSACLNTEKTDVSESSKPSAACSSDKKGTSASLLDDDDLFGSSAETKKTAPPSNTTKALLPDLLD